MQVLIWILFVVYGCLMLFVFSYSIIQLSLALKYLKKKKELPTDRAQGPLPQVTIQLPVFNEKYVVERLIKATLNMDYPKELLEVQVLDDSTDETQEITQKWVDFYQAQGFDIVRIHRTNRAGFKAGALAEGTEVAKGEFIAVFDADFLPRTDFLRATLPSFKDEQIGMVQTRWEHLNQNYNMLTRLQAFGLDAHFTVEQAGRNALGHFINFNGTAGIWRKKTISDAGGWNADTLTEDLDLSYRAQLKGWKFLYLEDHGSPAELPAAIHALKTQQYRWTKGAAECAVKNLPKVLKQKELPWATRMHATFHLLNSFVFVCILVTGVLSVPLLLIKSEFAQYNLVFEVAAIFSISFLFLALFYGAACRVQFDNTWKMIRYFVQHFPLFLAIYMGLSLHNAVAVVEGYLGRKTPFVRTPKFNIVAEKGGWKGNAYLKGKAGLFTYLELILTFYFIAALGIGYYVKDWGLYPFHIMLAFGFGTISLYSLVQVKN
ncbi:glycosyltransferase family 2 protein [bacterium SCSIO 12741]|nr:glycosyltransferase family 2 protein [bacterium SCSIO 12741]